jgi:hypothetical protein
MTYTLEKINQRKRRKAGTEILKRRIFFKLVNDFKEASRTSFLFFLNLKTIYELRFYKQYYNL